MLEKIKMFEHPALYFASLTLNPAAQLFKLPRTNQTAQALNWHLNADDSEKIY